MDIRKAIKQGITIEYHDPSSHIYIVDVDFVNSDGDTDETQFDIEFLRTRDGEKELAEVWKDFCKDQGMSMNSVISLTIVG